MSNNPFWSEFVSSLEPYVPGEQPLQSGMIKLNTNENPYGPSAQVIATVRQQASDQLRLYPPPNADLLKGALADYYGLENDQVFVGNGSDEVLAHAFNALLRHQLPVLFADITYSFYPVFCRLYDIAFETIALDDALRIDVKDYNRANAGVVIANPNAPTGHLLSLAEIELVAQLNSNSVVIVDEAYIDFGGQSAVSLIDRYHNLLVVQTFSKSRSLAGLRLGFALGNSQLIEALDRVKNCFNSYPLDSLALAAGVAALADNAYFIKTCDVIISTRSALIDSLCGLGFEVVPSSANFVFVCHPKYRGADLADKLRENKIIVRHFKGPRTDNYIRITVGTAQQMSSLVEALTEIIG